jgi:hypothetical protein
MKIITLALSACVSACVSAPPVARTDGGLSGEDAPPAGESLKKPRVPSQREAVPTPTKLALSSYVINLESSLEPFEVNEMTGLDGFKQRLLYTTEYPLISRTLHRLRLGFFANKQEAEKARAELLDDYPQAWITRASERETMAALPSSGVKVEPLPEVGLGAKLAQTPLVVPDTVGLGVRQTRYPEGMPPSLESDTEASAIPVLAVQEPLERIGLVSDASATEKDDPSTEVSYGREDDESLFVRSTHNGGDLFTVGTAFTQRRKAHDLQARADAGEEKGFWHMDMSSVQGGTGPKFQAEFAQSSFDPETSQGFGSSENRMVKLATFGSWQGYDLGLGYQAVGNEFKKDGKAAGQRKNDAGHPNSRLQQGRQATEAWMGRQFGDLNVKTRAALYQDQANDAEGAPQYTTQQLGASLNYTILSWPEVGVTLDYDSGVRSGDASESTSVDVESIATSLYYSGTTWSGALYIGDTTGAGTTDTMDLRTYYLGGSYYPVSTFSLSPDFTYWQEEYVDLGATTDNYMASMSASYRPSSRSRFSFDGYSEVSTQKNAEWAMDTEYYYSSLGVKWVSDRQKPLIKQWSFEVFHDQYIDNVYSGSNTGGLGVWLTLKSSPTPIDRYRYVDGIR